MVSTKSVLSESVRLELAHLNPPTKFLCAPSLSQTPLSVKGGKSRVVVSNPDDFPGVGGYFEGFWPRIGLFWGAMKPRIGVSTGEE